MDRRTWRDLGEKEKTHCQDDDAVHISLVITHQDKEHTFSAFLSPLSKAFTASLSAFTTSAGLF